MKNQTTAPSLRSIHAARALAETDAAIAHVTARLVSLRAAPIPHPSCAADRRAESDRLRAALHESMRAFSALSRRDMTAHFSNR